MKKTLLSAAAIIIAGVSSNAQTFGTPPALSGPLPNAYGNVDPSQSTSTQSTLGRDTVTLSLDVTPHFSATPVIPPVNTISTGVYGVSTGTGVDGRTFWNYDFAATSSLNLLSTYTFTLNILNVNNGQSASYNPAPNAIGDDHVVVNASGTTFGNGESLDFTLTAPAFFGAIGYDPTANDQYDITLTAIGKSGATVGSDSIVVIAGTGTHIPDATSTMGLMSASLAALGLISRRFRK